LPPQRGLVTVEKVERAKSKYPFGGGRLVG
jgi:hypothetical protein